jgi:hypothetical protein
VRAPFAILVLLCGCDGQLTAAEAKTRVEDEARAVRAATDAALAARTDADRLVALERLATLYESLEAQSADDQARVCGRTARVRAWWQCKARSNCYDAEQVCSFIESYADHHWGSSAREVRATLDRLRSSPHRPVTE